LLVVVCVLAFAAGPAHAQDRAREPAPTALWEEYPLDPSSEEGASVSVQAVRRIGVPAFVTPAPSPSDSTLLIGGFALTVLILSDTVFLTVLRRRLRESAFD
jgi:hypothetical protein